MFLHTETKSPFVNSFTNKSACLLIFYVKITLDGLGYAVQFATSIKQGGRRKSKDTTKMCRKVELN